jgi:hypothetical protein
VINETIKPDEEPRIMKAIPLHAGPKFGTFSAAKPRVSPLPKSSARPSATPVRRAIPVSQLKKEKANGQ